MAMNWQPLFPGRDLGGSSDPLIDRLLRTAFVPPTSSRQHEVAPPKEPAIHPQVEPPPAYARTAPTPIPPLIKAYWALCTGLLLAVIQFGCSADRQADSSFARIQTSLVQADTNSLRAEQLGNDLPTPPEHRVQTWIREDQPSIEITGPIFENPYQDWAPRAVLERLPALN